jgi:hypothetical protein
MTLDGVLGVSVSHLCYVLQSVFWAFYLEIIIYRVIFPLLAEMESSMSVQI